MKSVTNCVIFGSVLNNIRFTSKLRLSRDLLSPAVLIYTTVEPMDAIGFYYIAWSRIQPSLYIYNIYRRPAAVFTRRVYSNVLFERGCKPLINFMIKFMCGNSLCDHTRRWRSLYRYVFSLP